MLPTDPAEDLLLSIYNPQAYILASSNATDANFRPVIQTLPNSLEENNESLDASFSQHLNSLSYHSAEYLDLEYYMFGPLPDSQVSSLHFPFAGAQLDHLNVATPLPFSQATGNYQDATLGEGTGLSVPRLDLTSLLDLAPGSTVVSEEERPSLQEITNNLSSIPSTSTSVETPRAKDKELAVLPVKEEEKENVSAGPPAICATSSTRKRKYDLDDNFLLPIAGSSTSFPVPVVLKSKKQRNVGPPPPQPVAATPAAFEPTRIIVHPLPKYVYLLQLSDIFTDHILGNAILGTFLRVATP